MIGIENKEALVFTIAFGSGILMATYIFIVQPIISRIFKRKAIWVYGTCRNRKARKDIVHKNVQFVLWKAGQQGHKVDFWIDFDSSWWHGFEYDKNSNKII